MFSPKAIIGSSCEKRKDQVQVLLLLRMYTLDKSRRRDTMFPQSFVLQVYLSDHLWLAISHVISSWGKKQREKLYSVKSDFRHRTRVE